jgi:hypothetical protein
MGRRIVKSTLMQMQVRLFNRAAFKQVLPALYVINFVKQRISNVDKIPAR